MTTDVFKQLPNPTYSEFIYKSRYARWRDDLGRRENWDETVTRYIDFFKERFPEVTIDWKELWSYIYEMKVMPSMRALMTAGKALEKDHVAGYNCAYVAIDDVSAFSEIMYILMCGTGVGFSVERQFVNELPKISEEMYPSDTTIVVRDSKLGWATGFKELISLLYSGRIPSWDLSKIRPAGARLKTFGGRASGPDPLDRLFNFTVSLFKKAKGRRLNSIECHDLVCMVADIVVVGGVRRSALISLSNLTDERMRKAKSGAWWVEDGQRALANNSVCYTEKPEIGIFLEEWLSLYQSKSGERGVFNREACNKLLPERRKEFDYDKWGTNPCSEIVLRSGQFCNLTEVIIRPEDTFEDIRKKVEVATILGTLQSSLTDFRFLRKLWKTNCEEERLLGVSLTGIMDHLVFSGLTTGYDEIIGHDGMIYKDFPVLPLGNILQELKEYAKYTNEYTSSLLGISPSTAITCVKPSGTVSQLVDTASGIHPRYSRYYIRTVRADQKDPLAQFLIDQGISYEVDVTKPNDNYVFSFKMKSPERSIMRDGMSAIDQLEHWKTYLLNWCEHKPSITVYVREYEWMEVGAWVYENFDILSGVSFLPHTDHVYQQAPYQEITEEQFNEFPNTPEIDWNLLVNYENDDFTVSAKELACSAGVCEI